TAIYTLSLHDALPIYPRVDFFSVYVQGLTNAYRWVDPPEGFKKGDSPGTGRVLLQKTLMLNFWRPGDEYVEDQRIIRYGIPGKEIGRAQSELQSQSNL